MHTVFHVADVMNSWGEQEDLEVVQISMSKRSKQAIEQCAKFQVSFLKKS